MEGESWLGESTQRVWSSSIPGPFWFRDRRVERRTGVRQRVRCRLRGVPGTKAVAEECLEKQEVRKGQEDGKQ